VLKAVGLILGVQILMWILGTTFFTFFFNFVSLDSMDQLALFRLANILGSITSFLSSMEVPILYFTR
jgi:hypothetical protein